MPRWTVRVLMVVIAALMVVWVTGAAAGALTTKTDAGGRVLVPGAVAPAVIPSPERPPA